MTAPISLSSRSPASAGPAAMTGAKAQRTARVMSRQKAVRHAETGDRLLFIALFFCVGLLFRLGLCRIIDNGGKQVFAGNFRAAGVRSANQFHGIHPHDAPLVREFAFGITPEI